MTSTKEDLLERIKSSYTAINSGKNQPSKDKKILKAIRKIKIDKASEELRLYAAQWIIIHHLMSSMRLENTKQAEAIIKASKADLPLAWKLVDCDFKNEQFQTTAVLLRADISQKLQNYERLAQSFHDLLKLPETTQVNMIIASIAPLLADWKTFERVCLSMEAELENKMVELKKLMPQTAESYPIPTFSDILHQVAETGMADLGVLYNFAKSENISRIPTPNPKDLFFENIHFDHINLNIKSIHTDTEEKRKEIRQQFEDQEDLNLENTELIITGGIISMPGLSQEVPLYLYGVYVDESCLKLEGYSDLQMQTTDENGAPQIDPASLNQEMLQNMNPELIQALQSGQMNPEMMQDYGINQNNSNVFPPGPDGFMNQMAQNMTPPMTREQLQQMGIVQIRQHETIELHKTEFGYVGSYIVRNYEPEMIESKEDNETSITFDIEIKCSHPKAPNKSISDIEPIEKISAGIDNLDLD